MYNQGHLRVELKISYEYTKGLKQIKIIKLS